MYLLLFVLSLKVSIKVFHSNVEWTCVCCCCASLSDVTTVMVVIRIVYYVYELNIIQKCWCFSREKYESVVVEKLSVQTNVKQKKT